MSGVPIDHQPGDLAVTDECYRCGYDLRGIGNDAPCPECGLLAERSRRVSDELHDTRPKWLRKLSWGINLILLAVICSVLAPVMIIFLIDMLPYGSPFPALVSIVVGLPTVLLMAGSWLLASSEGYASADKADARLRVAVRVLSVVPLLAFLYLLASIFLDVFVRSSEPPIEATGITVCLVLSAFTVLLFARLRGLAKRARSAHLAEHCLIVGTGAAAAIVFGLLVYLIFTNTQALGFDDNWINRSMASLILLLLLITAATLFLLWSLYLLIRFAIAFWIVSRSLRAHWKRDDRSLDPSTDV